MSTPLSTALGYGWRCPYCGVLQDEGQRTGVYYIGKAVCGSCAPLLSDLRAAAARARPPIAHPRLHDAAPDLLLACQVALHDRMFKEWPEVATLLMNAIKKAGGEL